ncbi:MAG TPA: hypothetical protein VGX23_28655 [Actinocrinis sp.]|nr:hypothetical protein [Actinocrinis sp.]
MELNEHRKPRPKSPRGRRALRLGLLTTASLATLGAIAGGAQAVSISISPVPGIGVADDTAHALANPGHQNRFEDSFTISQFGPAFAVTADNRATAQSAGCTAAKPCRSVALSFEIVTMAGTNIHLNADNQSSAQNTHCPGCQSIAGAYQFVVSTPGPFTLTAAEESRLAAVHRQLDALSTSTAPIATVQQQADALAAQVNAILKAAVASAPVQPAVNGLTKLVPNVAMHRTYQQN